VALIIHTCRARRLFANNGKCVGEYYGGTPLEPVRLDKIETSLEGQDKERFLRFMRKMLQWEPDKRHSALELLEDEWVRIHTK
jgi:hypothetical protein